MKEKYRENKWCRVCEIWVSRTLGVLRCPECKQQLRDKPRNPDIVKKHKRI